MMTPIMDPVNNLRRYLYAFGTDLEAFFHNVLVDHEDNGAFRFFFFEDESMEKLIPYLFLAHIFGATSSPMVTAFVLRYHAEVIKDEFGQEIYYIIKKYFYVDDGAGGSDDKIRYKVMKEDLEKAMKKGGFSLSKWKFSHPELIEHEGHEQKEEEKILGIKWNMKEDRLSVEIDKEKYEEEVETLRQLVKLQASLYDPLGILAPFILLGRKIIQMAMQGKWGWDIKLSREVVREATGWLRSIKHMGQVSIPRPWNNEDTVGMKDELHVFSDASEGGYGAVMYRRVVGRSGEVRVAFLEG